ncbi:WD40 repeat domain-containing protein [Endozoicomonas euniceicola]|uniref:WD40 repeat protein n=1 Tax=Endozoicomonas euniceicola TaxID=1234143 RepID=A0ABY6GVZ6_9GAMM|nr:hypothetical protein [Endozoicomonas euniceicola]UYM16934.1 hypothetical protein NX720_03140 [Endozoicomonas euniceicola]
MSPVATLLLESPWELYKFSPDSKLLFVVDYELLSIYDVAACTNDLMQQQKEYYPCGTLRTVKHVISEWDIHAMAISENSELLALGDHKGEVQVFSVTELLRNPHDKAVSPLATFKHAKGFISAIDHEYVEHVAFSKDGNLVISSAEDSTVKVWRVSSGYNKDESFLKRIFRLLKRVRRFPGIEPDKDSPVVTLRHDQEVKSAVFSPDNNKIISMTESSYCFWNFNSGSASLSVKRKAPDIAVQSFDLNPDLSEKAHNCYMYKKLSGDVQHASMFSPDGKLAVLYPRFSESPEVGMELWSTQALLSDDAGASVRSIAILKHYSGTYSDLTKGGKEREASQGSAFDSNADDYKITALAFGYDGNSVITGAKNGSVMLWDVRALKELSPDQEATPVETLQLDGPILNIHTGPGYSGIKIFSATGPVTTWYPGEK